ncbi:MAG: PD40 domain-containing protein [Elusimicrobia bacterium]|nr:PD40 domain-containing protein [Elusimicrobiota bacterium]
MNLCKTVSSRRRGLGALALSCLAAVSLGAGQALGFGQNRLVTKDLDWRVRSTDHFDIYYYGESKALVEESAAILEEAFATLSRSMDIETSTAPRRSGSEASSHWKRKPFFLYASPNDFLESTIVDVGEGTGGVTEPFKDRFMVYNDGSRKWLKEVIKHEFAHVLQYHALNAGFWKSGRILRGILYPLWMIEGWAAQGSKDMEETWEELVVRDAATSQGLIPVTRLEHFGHLKPHQTVLAYKEGAAAMEFIASEYGRRRESNMLRSLASHFESGAVLTQNIGIDANEFDRKFREHLETKYARQARVERLKEPDAYGRPLTRVKDSIPMQNSTPVFSPDGRTMYFLTTRRGFPPEIHRLDLSTGRSRRLPGIPRTRVENVSMGRFTNLSRELAISPDGRRLAFAGTKAHRDYLFVYDLERLRLERIAMPGLSSVSQPSFSPDGGRIVFSGMRDCRTDIYVHDLALGLTERLTEDDRDDQTPVFSPSGNWIVYSSEVPDPGHPSGWRRRLMRLRVSDRAAERLEGLPGSARDPVASPDGTRVLFVLEEGGFSELAELDVTTGRAVRLTRSIGGSFTPVYAPDGEIAFAALRRGSVHIHKGPRESFLSEELRQEGPRPPEAGARPEAPLSSERPYRFEAGTDLFLPAFFYSSDSGLFWTSYWQGSDLLGRHQSSLMLGYGSHDSYFDYTASYAYRRFRPGFYFALVGRGQRNVYDPDRGLDFNGSLHGQLMGVQYPLDRYHRFELGTAVAVEQLKYHGDSPRQDRETRAASLAFVRDTVRGRYLAVTEGDRLKLALTEAWDALGGNQRYDLLFAEAHRFVPTGGQSALAGRLLFLRSTGPQHPAYVVGGVGGVRGYPRGARENLGSQMAVANLEWRFPVIKDLNWYMWFFAPDFYFKAIYGTIFTDAGYLWESMHSVGRAQWRDLRHSVGLGLNIHTFVMQEFPFVVSLDYARQTTKDKGIFYVYLGQSF